MTDDSNDEPEATGKLKRKEYEQQLARLHVKFVKLQQWVVHKGLKVCIVFEGRDGAGKGGTIKAMTERVSPRVFRVVAVANVRPALHSASACSRRNRDLRPQLVQPGRRRARARVLYGGAGQTLLANDSWGREGHRR